MQQYVVYTLVGLPAALGLGLFAYNMFLARQGWLEMRRVKAQKASADAKFAAMQALIARSNVLRHQLEDRFGTDYARLVEPIDLLIGHANAALLQGKGALAEELILDACHEMEFLLQPVSH